VADGLILLGLIALAFAIVVTKGRRRLGLTVTGRVFAMAAVGFAILVLILWATQRR
jgi:1,4-dihydroxy-2-naphthoate octaprenyltransferase